MYRTEFQTIIVLENEDSTATASYFYCDFNKSISRIQSTKYNFYV